MNWPQVMWRVILPQAARIAVPPLQHLYLLVKDTSLAAAVTVPELFQAAQRLASVTYEPLILYVETALIYLLFSSVLSTLQDKLEQRLAYKETRGRPMIRLSGIEKQFAGQRVLKGVGLAMAAGSVTALIGPSGSKSGPAALREPAGATRCGPAGAGGSELDFAHHLSRQSVLSLRQQTGMVFQNSSCSRT